MTQKKYNVMLAVRADKMMLLHTAFLARISPAAARRLLADFKKAKLSLSENPFKFPFADELDAPGIPMETYRKCLFDNYKRYKALFLVEGINVQIDAIIDCRQENKDIF